MSKKWYGSVDARLEEGKNYTGRELRVGDDITTYYWSDQHCKYITEVIDQKHIFVKDYHVCADRSKEGGMGHQNWLYFKTLKEQHEYLNQYFTDTHYDENPQENEPEEWMFRYGKWNVVVRFTQETINKIMERDHYCLLRAKNEKEQKLLDEGKEVVHYHPISEGISFGVRNYYYDWEF